MKSRKSGLRICLIYNANLAWVDGRYYLDRPYGRYVESLLPHLDEVILCNPIAPSARISAHLPVPAGVSVHALPYYSRWTESYRTIPLAMPILRRAIMASELIYLRIPSPLALVSFVLSHSCRRPTLLHIVGDQRQAYDTGRYRGLKSPMARVVVEFNEWSTQYMVNRSLTIVQGEDLAQKHKRTYNRVFNLIESPISVKDVVERTWGINDPPVRLIYTGALIEKKVPPCTANCANNGGTCIGDCDPTPCTVNCNHSPCTTDCNPVPCTMNCDPCTSNCGPPPCTANCGNNGGTCVGDCNPTPCTMDCIPPPCTTNCTPAPCTINCNPSPPCTANCGNGGTTVVGDINIGGGYPTAASGINIDGSYPIAVGDFTLFPTPFSAGGFTQVASAYTVFNPLQSPPTQTGLVGAVRSSQPPAAPIDLSERTGQPSDIKPAALGDGGLMGHTTRSPFKSDWFGPALMLIVMAIGIGLGARQRR